MTRIAIYPGTFDPISHGHIHLIQRATTVFDQIVVAIAANPSKHPLFSLAERLQLAQQSLANEPNVTVEGFQQLLVEFAHTKQASVIIRGVRNGMDLDYETQQAEINQKLAPEIETIYMSPHSAYRCLASSLIKDIASHGGDLNALVPPVVATALIQKFRPQHH